MAERQVCEAQIVRFDVGRESICLDCLALGSGEPFSVVVGLPHNCWRPIGIAALERWAGQDAPLRLTAVRTQLGRRLSINGTSTRAVFDLVSEYPGEMPGPGDRGDQAA